MATNKHVNNLKSIREKLVDLRRSHAEYGAKNDPENAALNIMDVQKQIDVLDKAIAEEKELLPADVTFRRL